jgi:hypothetical protein
MKAQQAWPMAKCTGPLEGITQAYRPLSPSPRAWTCFFFIII